MNTVRTAGWAGAAAAAASAPWWAAPYVLLTGSSAAALGLVAVSVVILTGHAGLASLGQAVYCAAGAYTAGLLARHHVTDAGPVLLLAAAAAGACLAAITGALAVRTRGLDHLLMTVAFAELGVVALTDAAAVTGGSDGLSAIPGTRPVWGMQPMSEPAAVYAYTAVTAAAVAAAVTVGLRARPVRLILTGVRQAEVRARASGHRPGPVLWGAHAAAGAVAGTGGALLVTANGYVSPADAGLSAGILALAAATIGSVTSPAGALAAAAVITLTRDQVAASWPGSAPLLLGVLFAATALAPAVAGHLPRPAGPSAAHRGQLGTATAPPRPRPPGTPAQACLAMQHTARSGLTLQRVRVSYGPVVAVCDVDLDFPAGVHALVGPNGAGKSTLVGAVTGLVPARGRVLAAGTPLRGGPARRARAGLAVAFQQPRLAGDLTVAEQIDLARRGVPRPAPAAAALGAAGLAPLAGTRTARLSHGQRKRLDIAVALAAGPRVLLLDEPAAGLTDGELGDLRQVLAQLPPELTVVVVEHRLDLVRDITDTVTVLHRGRVLATGPWDQVCADPLVAETYPLPARVVT